MKRLITLFVLASMVLTIFAGCQSSGTDATQATTPSTEPSTEPTEALDPNVLSLEPPSQEIRKKIHDACLDKGILLDVENYPKYSSYGTWYYGSINGCIIIFREGNLFRHETIYVADSEFFHSISFEIYVYKDGEICVLKDAYEKGWLTKEHIKQLEARHPNVIDEMYKAEEEWHQSQKETQGN